MVKITTSSEVVAKGFSDNQISFAEAQQLVLAARSDPEAKKAAAGGGAYSETLIGGAGNPKASVAGLAKFLEGKGFSPKAAQAQAQVIHEAFANGVPHKKTLALAPVDGEALEVSFAPPAKPAATASKLPGKPTAGDVPLSLTPAFKDGPDASGLQKSQILFDKLAAKAPITVKTSTGEVTLDEKALRDIGMNKASSAALTKYGLDANALTALNALQTAGVPAADRGKELIVDLTGHLPMARLGVTQATLDKELDKLVKGGATPEAFAALRASHGAAAQKQVLAACLGSEKLLAAATVDTFDAAKMNLTADRRTVLDALYPGSALVDTNGDGKVNAGDVVLSPKAGGGVTAITLTSAEATEINYRTSAIGYAQKLPELRDKGLHFRIDPEDFYGNSEYWSTGLSKWFPAGQGAADAGWMDYTQEEIDSNKFPRCHPLSLTLKPGADAYKAVHDIFEHPDKYGLDCAATQVMVQLAALADAMGPDAFNAMFKKKDGDKDSGITITVSDKYGVNGGPALEKLRVTTTDSNFLPGDSVYFNNRPTTREWQGENTLYIGHDEYRGFPLRDDLKTKDAIIGFLNGERARQGHSGSASIDPGTTRFDFSKAH